ncbi:thioredoxin family protein [Aporhodopirellula aestuarii]|uniref:Thioredoxin family protein n=1 Tax=Aporhodopirellula aestuarii TaxID=2950107 RepID=A0ABT0TZX9_9BACT|nr:thioredoxin family protein [Aporhodopirellula aestuarii]MCM2370203.1 thioredoxin family protein [Aporhodopirellula aestuarii]
MNKTQLFSLSGLTLAAVTIAGCSNGNMVASRVSQTPVMQSPPGEPHPQSIPAEDIEIVGVDTPPVIPDELNETWVSSISQTRPLATSLITLSADDDLMAKVDSASGPVLLDFYADWCGPCQVQGKILEDMENVATEHQTLMIKINVDEHPGIARELQVKGIPTLIMVKDGRVVHRQSGVADRSELVTWMQ